MIRAISRPLAAAVASTVCALAAAAVAAAQTLPAPPAAKPADDAKALYEGLCGSCHGLATVTAERHTRAEWDDEVHRMTERGMVATEGQMAAVIDYLAKILPPAS